MTVIDTLRSQIRACEEKIAEIQSVCSHPQIVTTIESFGESDTHDIQYCACGLCDAKFRRDIKKGGDT
jgi:hypothetical protein